MHKFDWFSIVKVNILFKNNLFILQYVYINGATAKAPSYQRFNRGTAPFLLQLVEETDVEIFDPADVNTKLTVKKAIAVALENCRNSTDLIQKYRNSFYLLKITILFRIKSYCLYLKCKIIILKWWKFQTVKNCYFADSEVLM